MAKTGRPTDYTPELAVKICEELALGKSLRTVCKADDMPAMSSVFLWLREYDDFSEQYARAKQESADAMAEDVLEISDDKSMDMMGPAVIARAKLQVDTRKWLMAKMKPKKYGDSIDVTSGHEKLPTPIIPLNDVPRDNSNTED